jgi:hypothetical protein
MPIPFTTINTWLKRAENMVLSRGVEFLLITMPEVGKVYDKGLSAGRINWNKIPKEWGGVKSDLTRYLLLDTFREDGTLRNRDPNVIFMTRQVLYLYKKVQLDCTPARVRDAVDEFVEIEKGLREPDGTWNNDHWWVAKERRVFRKSPEMVNAFPRGLKFATILDEVFTRIVPQVEVDTLSIRPRHGPGAVADMKTGGDKYSFPHWPSKLDGVFPWSAFAQHREDLHITDEVISTLSPSEPAARLIAVPKTYKAPRLIASEPIAHQFLQQGLMSWIRSNMNPILRTSTNFLDQVPSREAALAASRRGDMATVDLSSASDRLSCWTVERAFGSNQSLLRALHAVRTRHLVDATGSYEHMSLRLKKFAAQGSAVTFPVQTIVYVGLSLAAICFTDNIVPTRRNLLRVARKVRVFGDDIIVPRAVVPILAAALDSLQLKVNVGKTHTSGAFRESCGMDAWCGHDVTPCYLTSWQWETSPLLSDDPTPNSVRDTIKGDQAQSWLDVSNNAHKKGLWRLSDWMTDQIPHKVRKKIATSNTEGDGFRLYSFCDGFVTDSQVRFSKELHREEALLLCLRARERRVRRGSWQDLYQWLIEAPGPQVKWEAGYPVRVSTVVSRRWVPVG